MPLVGGLQGDRFLGWQARSLEQTPLAPKYFLSSGLRKTAILYNLSRAAQCNGPLVICEGVFDCMRVGENAISLLGCTISPTQANLLRRYAKGKDVVILLDRDAEEKARAIAWTLRKLSADTFGKIAVARLPEHRSDPGESTKEEVWHSIDAVLGNEWFPPPKSKYRIVDGTKNYRQKFATMAMGSKVSLSYRTNSPSGVCQVATPPLLMAVSGINQQIHVVYNAAAMFLKRLNGKQRLYEDALQSKCVELDYDLPPTDDFHDLATAYRLLEVASENGATSTDPESRISSVAVPRLDGSLDEFNSAIGEGRLEEQMESVLPKLKQTGQLDCYRLVELPCLQPIASMTQNGLRVDRQY
ncbi:MAG: toprim domain-containing protein, partial [Lacipirellulaceae bacterium]